jgi:hypothetical protein
MKMKKPPTKKKPCKWFIFNCIEIGNYFVIPPWGRLYEENPTDAPPYTEACFFLPFFSLKSKAFPLLQGKKKPRKMRGASVGFSS